MFVYSRKRLNNNPCTWFYAFKTEHLFIMFKNFLFNSVLIFFYWLYKLLGSYLISTLFIYSETIPRSSGRVARLNFQMKKCNRISSWKLKIHSENGQEHNIGGSKTSVGRDAHIHINVATVKVFTFLFCINIIIYLFICINVQYTEISVILS